MELLDDLPKITQECDRAGISTMSVRLRTPLHPKPFYYKIKHIFRKPHRTNVFNVL